MKKYFTLILALAMLLAMSVPAMAENAGETEISLTVESSMESYNLVIPPTLEIDPVEKTAQLKVELSDVNLVWNDRLVVIANPANPDEDGRGGYLVKEGDANTRIHYTLQDGNGEIKNKDLMVASYAAPYGGSSESYILDGLKITVDDDYPGSGTYSDTLTFTVSLTDFD